MTDPLGPIVAVRTVSEDDDFRVIEGRAIPFGGPFHGKDTYGTFFSARTDLALEPPIKVWYNHGFDPDFGFSSLGRVTSVRTEEDGIWVQTQIDKRHKYYETRVKPLLDATEGPQLGFSAGSAEHSYREDPKSGELLAYPVHEISLTPTEANPWAAIAARSAEVIEIIAARATDKSGKPVGGPVGGKEREDIPDEDYAGPDKSFPIVDQASVDAAARLHGHADDPEGVKAKVIAIAKRKGLKVPDAWQEGTRSAVRMQGNDAAMAATAIQTVLYLRDCEAGETDQVAMLDKAVAALQDFITAELAEPAGAYLSGVRAGARNSASDQAHIDAIHAHVVALGAAAHADDDDTSDDSNGDDDTGAASRAGDTPTTLTIVERADPVAVRVDIDSIAARVAAETVRQLTG